MKYKREEHGLTIGPDGKIYAIGGFNGKHCLRTAERYDISTDKWEEIAPLHCARRSLSAVALPDGVYILGGYDGEHYLDSVEKFNLEKNEWTVVQPLNRKRCTMACVSSADFSQIFALGGYDGGALSIVERYDVMSGTWQVVSPMSHKRFMHAAVVVTVDA